MTKPVLGLILDGTLGLMDGLSGFFEPSLAPGDGQRHYVFDAEGVGGGDCDWIFVAESSVDGVGHHRGPRHCGRS